MTGTVCLTEPHAAYAIGPAERDQWLHCMIVALDRIGASEEVKAMLREPLFRIADTVRNQDHSGPRPEQARDPNIIARG
jgi:hemoglobin